MSVTFEITGMEVDKPWAVPCSKCNRTMHEAATGEWEDCEDCMGYGGVDIPQSAYELNMTHDNTKKLFRRLGIDLNLGTGGQINAEVLHQRLEGVDVMLLVERSTKDKLVIHGGVKYPQASRWVLTLQRMALKAISYGTTIRYY